MRILSGIQPTGDLHLGNYFGAVANWAGLQEVHDCYFCVVDLHAMTMPYNPEVLRQATMSMVFDLFACGVDPEKAVVFIQSLVPEHTELAWILNCLCPFGDLERMTQFKDKREQVNDKDVETYVSTGLFTYPVLQAADILVYRAEGVPVGKDQQQHLELCREIARRFNTRLGALFPEPQPLWSEAPKIMSLADPTKKMSKSLGPKHYISIYDEPKTIRKKVMSAVTDSGEGGVSPGVENLLLLLRVSGAADTADTMLEGHSRGQLRYSDLKAAVAEALIGLTTRFRERRDALRAAGGDIDERIRASTSKARKVARETLARARDLAGLPPRLRED
jgi:tryptophanyl-tRNA synthetase